MTKITIRRATINDVSQLAHVHVQCWQETYADLLPAELIASNNIKKRKDMWTQSFTRTAHNVAFVACIDSKVIGFCSWIVSGKQLNLMTLYVLLPLQRQKIGTKLMEQAVQIATEQQLPIYLWVLSKNHKARRFYENLGFEYLRDENHKKNYPDILDSLYILLR